MALTPKQRAFARELAVDGNATAAAVRAGYSPTSAATMGGCLARTPAIVALTRQFAAEHIARTEVTAERVLHELWKVGSADVRGLYDETGALKHPADLDDTTAACVAGVKVRQLQSRTTTTVGGSGGAGATTQTTEQLVEVKLRDKVKALDILAGIVGLTGPMAGTHNPSAGTRGSGLGSRYPGTAGQGPDDDLTDRALTRMTDAELAQAIEAGDRLLRAAEGG